MFDCGPIVGFDFPPGGVEHFPARNNNQVYSLQWLTSSEQLPNESLGPVSGNSISNFLAGRDAKARHTDVIGQGNAGDEPAAKPSAPLIYTGEFRPAAEREEGNRLCCSAHPEPQRKRRPFLYRQPLSPFRPATLEHAAAVLGRHADQKPVRAAAVPSVRLIRTFHRNP
jgi:hypothetical protein